jgi:hypothetical protein
VDASHYRQHSQLTSDAATRLAVQIQNQSIHDVHMNFVRRQDASPAAQITSLDCNDQPRGPCIVKSGPVCA